MGYDAVRPGYNPRQKNSTPSQREIEILKAKAEDLIRNDANAQRIQQIYADNIIGKGILPQIVSENILLKSDMEVALKKWADTSVCDYEGNLNLYGIQNTIIKEASASGNCFAIRKYVRRKKGNVLPFKIQVLGYEYLAKNMRDETNNIFSGIKYDKNNRPVSYFFYKELPLSNNTTIGFGQSYSTETVEIEAKDVAHIFDITRPAQKLGVSWFAPVINTLRDIQLFEEARLKQQQLQAGYALYVETDGEPEDFGMDADRSMEIVPGQVQFLNPGEKIVSPERTSTSDDVDFLTTMNKRLARGCNVPYEEFAQDYERINFTSGKMSRMTFDRFVASKQMNMFIPQFCDKLDLWLTEAYMREGILMVSQLGNFAIKHVPPRREMVDPVKESMALKTLVDNRFMSRQEAIQQLGFDYMDVMAEIEEDNKIQEEIGPDFLNTQQISVQDGDAPEEDPEDEDKDDEEDKPSEDGDEDE